jgi:AcrR family transcriptional regulator
MSGASASPWNEVAGGTFEARMRGLADILGLDDAGGPPQERVLQILTEACRLFATRGFDGVSVRDIAEGCGISKATLYHYFPDKDAMLRPLVLGTTRAMYERVQASIDQTAPPVEKLRRFMLESAAFFEQYRWAWIASSSVFWNDPQVRRRKERLAWRDRYEGLLRGILQEAVDQGEVRPLDVALAARLVLSALNWLPRWCSPEGPATAPEIAEGFYDMILHGFRKP